jgi:hypothetical protein
MKTKWEQREMFETFQPNRRGGASEYLIVGIDVGKETHHALFGTATGETFAEPFVFGNHRVGCEQLIARADELEVELKLGRAVFGVHPIAGYHKSVVESLIRHKERVVRVPPLAGGPERGERWWERHPACALAAVAERVARGQWAAVPEPELEGRRQLVGTRVPLEQQGQGVVKRIRHQRMAQYFPELERADGVGGGNPERVVLPLMRTGPGSERGRRRISRGGNAALRAALLDTARGALRCDLTIRARFTQGLAARAHERGVRRQREVKLAAKLLVVAWRLIERGGSFDPERFAS